MSALDRQQSVSAGGETAKALFNYTSSCEEELSLQVNNTFHFVKDTFSLLFCDDLKTPILIVFIFLSLLECCGFPGTVLSKCHVLGHMKLIQNILLFHKYL